MGDTHESNKRKMLDSSWQNISGTFTNRRIPKSWSFMIGTIDLQFNEQQQYQTTPFLIMMLATWVKQFHSIVSLIKSSDRPFKSKSLNIMACCFPRHSLSMNYNPSCKPYSPVCIQVFSMHVQNHKRPNSTIIFRMGDNPTFS